MPLLVDGRVVVLSERLRALVGVEEYVDLFLIISSRGVLLLWASRA